MYLMAPNATYALAAHDEIVSLSLIAMSLLASLHTIDHTRFHEYGDLVAAEARPHKQPSISLRALHAPSS